MLTSSQEPLSIGRNDPCFCNSGKKFRRCCGSLDTNRPPPHGISVIKDYLSPAECVELVARFKELPADRLKVVDNDNSTEAQTVRKYDDRRVCERVAVGELQEQLNNITRQAIKSKVQPIVGAEFEWFEAPQILKYGTGGFFTFHGDNGYFDPESERWVRTLDRDWSMLLYLGDHFEGGQLLFEDFFYELKPQPGMLVFFPSNGRYMHTAKPVTSGVRYALVSWMSLLGATKVKTAPPEEAVFLDKEVNGVAEGS